MKMKMEKVISIYCSVKCCHWSRTEKERNNEMLQGYKNSVATKNNKFGMMMMCLINNTSLYVAGQLFKL